MDNAAKTGRTILSILGCILVIAVIGAFGFLLFHSLASFTTVLPSFLRQPGNRPAPVEDRDLGWKMDLAYFNAQLPRLHPGPFAKTSQADFEKAVVALTDALPDLSDPEIAAQIMRLTAMVGDGHTRALPPPAVTFHFYPLALYDFKDGFYVVSALREYKDLLGLRLVKVGGMPVEQAVDALAPYIAHDNDSGLKLRVPVYLLSPEFLAYAGVTPPGGADVVYTFEQKGGETVTATLQPVADVRYNELFQSNPAMRPMFRPERANENYWFEKLPDTDILYIQYNRCIETKDLPMKTFAEKVTAALKGSGVQRVVVDLRYNGGGNSTVIEPLLKAIASSSKNQKNKLFVLVGRQTFSSAMLNALDFATQTKAIFIGEVPSGSPSHYGEVRSFTLPNSEMIINYSSKHFVTEGYTDTDFTPGVVIEATYDDFGLRRDPVMEYFLNPE